MSGFYIGVDGKARKVKGGYIGVDGKARKIKKGYIGDENGVARLCWSGIEPVFADNSWEQIATACQTRQIPDTWQIGDQKEMTINGVNYAIDIIGKNHDDYSDGSGKAPLTFQMHDCYATKFPMKPTGSNSGGWKTSTMRETHLPSILALMPTKVQNAIKEVDKRTGQGNYNSTIIVTADKLFLLSEVEVQASASHARLDEGVQYAYYQTDENKKKYIGGASSSYWLRSPSKADAVAFVAIEKSGYSGIYYGNSNSGVAFAFCF